jgi:DNA-binding response OmpR family regulator
VKLRALVVDDYRDCADTLAAYLRLSGHEVQTAYTPAEAMSAVESVVPDVLVLDVGLQGIDGYRLATKLCEQIRRRPLLVAITGFNGREEQSREAGFAHHFVKPYEPAELVARITASLERVPDFASARLA